MRFLVIKSKAKSIDATALVRPRMLLPLSPGCDSFESLHFANFDSHKSSAGENGVLESDVEAVRNEGKNGVWIEANDGKNAAHVADCISDWCFEVNFDVN
jgi:hypothetical protein